MKYCGWQKFCIFWCKLDKVGWHLRERMNFLGARKKILILANRFEFNGTCLEQVDYYVGG